MRWRPALTEPTEYLPLGRRLVHRPRLGGVLLGTVFFWESLNPTLLPRAAAVQALLCAALTAIGYAIGATISVVIGWVRGHMHLPALDTRLLRRIAWILAGLVLLLGLYHWSNWQNAQREMVDMPLVARSTYLSVLLIGAVLLAVFIAIGRLVGHLAVRTHVGARAVLPGWLALVAAVWFTFGFVSFVAQDFVFQRLVSMANAAYSTVDDTTEPGIDRPTSDVVSGGPNSLVPWRTLGLQGRTFTGGVTTPAQLERISRPGTEVRSPVRVYVGLQSADDAQARARLAVQELERTGAFRRRILVVATTTGTGWINPRSARAVEAIYGGDSAIVGMQYSYLPSWISFLVDLDKASEAGTALFEAVHARWSQEPEATRPRLILFGESLGSYGSEASQAGSSPQRSVDRVLRRAEGALWVGPTWTNAIRTPIVLDREAGSPSWRPVFEPERVSFSNSGRELLGVKGPPIVYEQHASDPVGWWNWSAAYRRPAWLDGTRGYDVPARAHWFPIVTWGQTSADLIAGFSTPPGHGHNYDNAWVQAWGAAAAPPGWTAADTELVAARVAALPPQPGG